jgi:hypothetical protein
MVYTFSYRCLLVECYILPDCGARMLVQGSLTEGEGSVRLTSSLDQLLFYIENIINLFYKTSYLNEEVNSTEPSPLVSIPWLIST